jgi:hypothetical protein
MLGFDAARVCTDYDGWRMPAPTSWPPTWARRAQLLGELRTAIAALALEYESVAFAGDHTAEQRDLTAALRALCATSAGTANKEAAR